MSSRESLSVLNPQRIQWCCNQLHITIGELARQLGINEGRLAGAQLTMPQLRKVADYFDHSIFFFAEPDEPKETIHSPQFRTIGEQARLDSNLYKLIRRAERHRDLFIEMLESAGDKSQFSPPVLEGDMAHKAEAVRNWLGIDYNRGESYGFDEYRELIEAKGIFVQQSMGYKGKWKVNNPDKMLGFSLTHTEMPIIFVTKTSEARQAFTLLHELGHLLLHRDSFFDNDTNFRSSVASPKEQEANAFAGHFFLTDEVLSGLNVPKTYEEYDEYFEPIAGKRGISVEVVVVALLKKDQIRQRDYDSYIQFRSERWSGEESTDEKSPRTWRHREPFHIFGKRYVNAVLDSIQRGDTSLYKACKSLDNIQVSAIQRLLHGD